MRRYLIVGNQSLGSDALYDAVRECLARGPCSFHIVVPATSPTERVTWTEAEARAIAHDRLDRALSWIGELEPATEGEVGDTDPMLAIWDTLRERAFDQIIISTMSPDSSRWLGMDLPDRVKARFRVPVSVAIAEASHETTQ